MVEVHHSFWKIDCTAVQVYLGRKWDFDGVYLGKEVDGDRSNLQHQYYFIAPLNSSTFDLSRFRSRTIESVTLKVIPRVKPIKGA